MFKSIGILQLTLAPALVLPAMTGQESPAGGIEGQLEATLQSIEYLRGLEVSVRTGDPQALRALERSTEPARDATPQRAAHLEALQDDIARLRFSLDRLLADPSELEAIMSMPVSVQRALGLVGKAPAAGPNGAGAQGTATMPFPTGPSVGTDGTIEIPASTPDRTAVAITDPAAARPETVAGVGNTIGLTEAARSAMKGELGPLDNVRETSRRRGNEPVALEGDNYVADPVGLGRLLVRSKRPAEAVEVLSVIKNDAGARYWLARAYQQLDRTTEALEIFRALSADDEAGVHQRHAKQDLEFLEFKQALKKRRR